MQLLCLSQITPYGSFVMNNQSASVARSDGERCWDIESRNVRKKSKLTRMCQASSASKKRQPVVLELARYLLTTSAQDDHWTRAKGLI